MTNTLNKNGQLVRWESYERDKANMICSKWEHSYIVVNLGTGKGKGKKTHEMRTYRVTRDEEKQIHCTCEDHIKNNTICKHILLVGETYSLKKQAERQKQEEVSKAIARW